MNQPATDNRAHKRALQHQQAGRHEQALACLQEHLLARPKDAVALNDAGVVLFSLGRYEESIHHLEAALRCPAADETTILANLAEVLLAAGRPLDAAGLLGTLAATGAKPEPAPGPAGQLAASPQANAPADTAAPGLDLQEHYNALKDLGDRYAEAEDLQRARGCYRGAAALAPQKAEPHVALGVLAIQNGRPDEAERAFRTAIGLDNGCAEAYSGLAMIHQQRGEPETAFGMYLRCLELDTDNMLAMLGLFQTSCQMGSFEKIIHYLRTYLQRHPGDTSVLFCLATLYAREGRLDEAYEALLDVLALEPDKTDARKLLDDVESALAGRPLPAGPLHRPAGA